MYIRKFKILKSGLTFILTKKFFVKAKNSLYEEKNSKNYFFFFIKRNGKNLCCCGGCEVLGVFCHRKRKTK